jgi:hypothetical protein
MKTGDLVLVRLRIAARLDQADAVSPGGEIRRQGTAARSGADDDVFEDFVRRLDGVPPAQNVLSSSISAFLSASGSALPNSWPLSS